MTTIKEGEEDPFEGRNNGDEDEDKEEEIEKDNTIMGETQKKTDDMDIAKEQHEEQSVQDTQMPSMSPPHDTSMPAETITVKDVPDISAQKINPLTTKYWSALMNFRR